MKHVGIGEEILADKSCWKKVAKEYRKIRQDFNEIFTDRNSKNIFIDNVRAYPRNY